MGLKSTSRKNCRESKEKRERRPVFIGSDGKKIRGLLPEEIAEFYARVNQVRDQLMAKAAVRTLRPRAIPQGQACRTAFR
jgi:hypothetical protein